MRRFKCWCTVFLLWGTTAIAQTDLLNLGAYQEGDAPSYGEHIVVQQDENTGIKWISQQDDAIDTGSIKFPVTLSGDFELFIEIDNINAEELFLISDDRIKLEWNFNNELLSLSAGEDIEYLNQSNASKNSGINKIRFSVVNNVAKVYMNEVFDGKITLKPDLVYTPLIMQNIGKNTKIYALTTSGSTTEPTSDNCMATYSLDGKVHIPCISVPNPFGGTTVYDVKMQQQVGTFTFDLELGSVKPR